MPRKQGSAAALLPDLPERSTDPGHIQALRRNSRTFTLADQVNRLVGASETTPDRGFLGRTMALCSLPRSNPGNRHQYKRVNGPYKSSVSLVPMGAGKPASATKWSGCSVAPSQ